MIRYLTGATGSYLEDGTAFEFGIGLLIQPRNGYWARVERYPAWAADNGAFSKHGFDAAVFRTMLARPNLRAARSTCLFVVAPDKLVVLAPGRVIGDARGTLEQFPAWAEEISAYGFPVALVAQDGLETMLEDVPWTAVDVLFLGGSTEWKIGSGAHLCVEAARARAKRTHMGRVNSFRRLALAESWGVDTADGTFLGFGPRNNLPRLTAWLDQIAANGEESTMSRSIYLAGGIHGLSDDAATSWRTAAKQLLVGFAVLDPMRRNYRGREAAHVREIVDGDLRDILASSAILAACCTPSWGTAMEIRFAKTVGVLVFAFCEVGPPSPWLLYHCDTVAESLSAAVACLRVAFRGK